MRIILLIAVVIFVFPHSLEGNELPLGKLGLPIGTYLTIEGHTPKPNRKSSIRANPTNTLIVDTVNGKRLKRPVYIEVRDLKKSLPQNVRIVIKGYESGTMIGTPPGAIQAAEEVGKEILLPPYEWQFYRFFVLTSWVKPMQSIKIKRIYSK